MFEEMKEQLKWMQQQDYRSFIKALISLEYQMENEHILDELYEIYMENDDFSLLNTTFQNFLSE